MEFMPTKGRGVWLIWLEAFWTLGSCIEAGLAWLVLDSLGWRWLLALSSIPLGESLLYFLHVTLLPKRLEILACCWVITLLLYFGR